MDVAQEVRAARQGLGWSQRELAARAGVAASTVGAVEAGTHGTSAAVLQRLLGACGRRLVSVPVATDSTAVDVEALRAHLRASLHARLRGALARAFDDPAPVLHGLSTARAGSLRLVDNWAASLWVPDVPLEAPVVLRAAGTLADPASVAPASAPGRALPGCAVLPALQGPQPEPVRVPVSAAGWVGAGAPAALADDVCLRAWQPWLRTAVRLLDEEAGEDGGGRRGPVHRQPDELEEAHRLSRAVRYCGVPRPVRPDPLDGRAWRLDAPVGLPQWLAEQDLPPLLGRRPGRAAQ